MHSKSFEVCSLLDDSYFKTLELKNWRIHLEVGSSLLMSSKIVVNGDNGLELCKPYATLGFLLTDTFIYFFLLLHHACCYDYFPYSKSPIHINI